MKYSDIGLVNTEQMFQNAINGKYAIPAFNIYNMETLMSVLDAARIAHSPVILAVSESALKYMGADMLIGMIRGANITPDEQIALHLDHGSNIDICTYAIENGFSSVMIDASKLPLDQNIDTTKHVIDIAHKHNISVEAELGTLSGIEDENTFGTSSSYTNPEDAIHFIDTTGVDSLAIAIGTSHGAYKRKSDNEELRFDILAKITQRIPNMPLVLHGASNIPQELINTINEYGGQISGARGIDINQLKRAITMNVCKINVDSDLRLAFTAGVRQTLSTHPETFNPRDYLGSARSMMIETCLNTIKNIMGSENKTQS